MIVVAAAVVLVLSCGGGGGGGGGGVEGQGALRCGFRPAIPETRPLSPVTFLLQSSVSTNDKQFVQSFFTRSSPFQACPRLVSHALECLHTYFICGLLSPGNASN